MLKWIENRKNLVRLRLLFSKMKWGLSCRDDDVSIRWFSSGKWFINKRSYGYSIVFDGNVVFPELAQSLFKFLMLEYEHNAIAALGLELKTVEED